MSSLKGLACNGFHCSQNHPFMLQNRAPIAKFRNPCESAEFPLLKVLELTRTRQKKGLEK